MQFLSGKMVMAALGVQRGELTVASSRAAICASAMIAEATLSFIG